jgi:hypothetical protein
MSRFLIRIQLNHTEDEKGAIYSKLYNHLFDAHIYNALRDPSSTVSNPTWYALPRATYFTEYYHQTSASAILAIVNTAIKAAIDALKADGVVLTPPPIASHTVVADAEGKPPFATDFPKVDSPQRK